MRTDTQNSLAKFEIRNSEPSSRGHGGLLPKQIFSLATILLPLLLGFFSHSFLLLLLGPLIHRAAGAALLLHLHLRSGVKEPSVGHLLDLTELLQLAHSSHL